MAEKIYQCKIRGLSPLIMHNGQLANPFNPFVKAMKEIKAKKGKTEADTMEIARLSWLGGLYVANKKVILPQYVIQACLLNASKKFKLGKSVGAGLMVMDNAVLDYPDTGLSFDDLYQKEDYQFFRNVRVGQSTVMNMRPIFPVWACEFTIRYYDDLFEFDTITQIIRKAGDLVGLGDWRPEKYGSYGRFELVE